MHPRRLLAAGLLLLTVLVAGRPAGAGVHVSIGGVFGVPIYRAPYLYPYPVVPPPPYAPVPPPPPAWSPGHWEWRQDAWGRPVQVWVPTYLR